MTDMPDTTTTSDPSHHADSEQETDDAVGYYTGIIPIGTFNDVASVRDAPAFVGTITAN